MKNMFLLLNFLISLIMLLISTVSKFEKHFWLRPLPLLPTVSCVGLWEDHHLHQQPACHQSPAPQTSDHTLKT